MGNFIQHLSDRVSVIASDRLWLEDAALQHTKTTSNLPGMARVVGLAPVAARGVAGMGDRGTNAGRGRDDCVYRQASSRRAQRHQPD